MMFSRIAGRRIFGPLMLATAACALTASARPVWAESPPTTLATLLDRAYIEDMLLDYYSRLGNGHPDYGSFYAADGVLDVNGIETRGSKAIDDLYLKLEASAGSAVSHGKFRMLLTNPRIVVNGNTATADMLWTGIIADTIKAPPRLVENGREHDELVKQNGKWLFKLREITADSGMPAMFDKSYKPR